MSDYCDMGKLLPATRDALEVYASERNYGEWLRSKGFMQPEWLAWLTFLLQAEPDTEELFPHGKWATIQQLQGLVMDAVRR